MVYVAFPRPSFNRAVFRPDRLCTQKYVIDAPANKEGQACRWVSLPSNKRPTPGQACRFSSYSFPGEATTCVSLHIPVENTCAFDGATFCAPDQTFVLRRATDLFEMRMLLNDCLRCGCSEWVWRIESVFIGPCGVKCPHYRLPKFSVRDHRLTKKLLYALIKTVFRLHILNDPRRKAPLIRLL